MDSKVTGCTVDSHVGFGGMGGVCVSVGFPLRHWGQLLLDLLILAEVTTTEEA